jgi:hypothetical protein
MYDLMVKHKENVIIMQYIIASVAIHEAVWIQNLLAWTFDLELELTLIHCDDQSFMNISKNILFS